MAERPGNRDRRKPVTPAGFNLLVPDLHDIDEFHRS